MTFYELFDNTKDNRIKVWYISVTNKGNHSIIEVSHGLKDGKKINNVTVISKGKNIGKKNETSHYQQAMLEANSRYKKKKDTGYIENIAGEMEFPVNNNNELPCKPMLAHDYTKHSKKVKFPCYVQPKLDGYRMVFNPITKKSFTRTGEEYQSFYKSKLYDTMSKDLKIDYCIDGEFYVHDINFDFENYGVLRKIKNLTVDVLNKLNNIEYHVYDIIAPKLTFKERLVIIENLPKINGMKIVSTKIINNKEQLELFNNKVLEEGYEGTMLRNTDSLYRVGFRSYDLLKYKIFDDEEFKIVDYTYEEDTLAKGKMIIWICETNGLKRFNAQSIGTKKERKELYKEADKYIGKYVTVKFFGYTKEGIPRFPKTLRAGKLAIRESVI